MIVQSTRKEAARKRKTTHVHGKLGKHAEANAASILETGDEARSFEVKFSTKDLPSLKRIVARLEKMKTLIPAFALVIATALTGCSTAGWKTAAEINGKETVWSPVPGKAVTLEQARADLNRCTALANTFSGGSDGLGRPRAQSRCMIENGYQVTQVGD